LDVSSALSFNTSLLTLSRQDFDNKKRLVAWFSSNCETPSQREQYVTELKRFLPVDIFGKCGTLGCRKYSPFCTRLLNNSYKFYLSFENSLCDEYVTEKVYRFLAQRINVIPVVYGGANYSNQLPPKSFIDASQFDSPQVLAEFLMRLSKNYHEFASYFAWRQHYVCEALTVSNTVKFCQKVFSFISAGRQVKHKRKISELFSVNKTCRNPSLVH
jgi:alpha-1,3-fucosyltransferase